MKLFRLCTIAICALALCTISCSDGEDGTDGIDGIEGKDGDNGSNGTNGVNGQNGQDGVGFDELTKFGDITVQLVGTRPDDEPFSDSKTYRFAPVEAGVLNSTNDVQIFPFGGGATYQFQIARFYANPDDIHNDNFISFYILINNVGEEDESLLNATITINNHAVIDDGKFFIMNDFFSSGMPNTLIPEFEFSDMAFDPDTNHLSFAYRLLATADGNSSENDLTVTGAVDVTLLEQIPLPDDE
ncbi:hypothetical protein KIM67_08150 [Flagellimonas sp. 389]|uniref:hypothetical protein n=1 Tax=Flagellimonas sp. 389 TaxID=2835862 RepID=UPI001BD4F0F8|nr:hypothetical protein [Flagellimonas sp. 389]MBS9462377.1 hypothetical protein [Flagellimonas sp. 389]